MVIKNLVIVGAGTAGLLSALMIREKFPKYNITIVKSDSIGIVGVGEGSTEHWKYFCNFVGIDIKQLITETDATLKSGILFKNWNGDDKEYVHNLGPSAKVSDLNRHDSFIVSILINNITNTTLFPLSPSFEKTSYKNKIIARDNINFVNQYHFDTFKLNKFLIKICLAREIKFITDDVIDIDVNEKGFVTSLLLKNKKIFGDFFIDCSGFKRVLSQMMKVKWLSYKKYLPCNRAVAFPTEHDTSNYEPYTQAISMKNGWMWRIPTQKRYGNGYVFSDLHTNIEEVKKEIDVFFNRNVEITRDISFEAGRVEYFWHKNIVSIGLSGAFIEPLEAQSIGFTITQIYHLINLLQPWQEDSDFAVKKYNYDIIEIFHNNIDFIQLHYICKRNDTKFWRDKNFELTEFNKNTIDIFKKGFIQPNFFKEHFMFKSGNFFQIYYGLGLLSIKSLQNIFESNRDNYNNSLISIFETENKFDNLVLIDHNICLNNITNET